MPEDTNTPAVTPQPEPPKRETFKVRIANDKDRGIVIETFGRQLPNKQTIYNHLSTLHQRAAKKSRYWDHYSYTLQRLIADTLNDIPLQAWSDAVGKALLFEHRQKGEAVSEGLETIGDGAYLAMGNHLYKLSPIEVIDTTKGLIAAKRKATEEIKAEITKLREDSTASAAKIVTDAQINADALIQKANKIKRDAELAARTRGFFPNENILNSRYPLKKVTSDYDGVTWEVGYWVPFTIDLFTYTYPSPSKRNREVTKTWQAKEANSVDILVWTPFNVNTGEYGITRSHIDQICFPIPHMTHDSSCMAPATAPKLIKSADDIVRLASAIEQCMNTVNLSSLFGNVIHWHDAYQDFYPEELVPILKEFMHNSYTAQEMLTKLAEKDLDDVVLEHDEEQTTWTA